MLVVTMPLGGISGGTQPILSFNYGARKVDRVMRAQKRIFRWCLAFVAIMFGVAWLAGGLFARLFTSDALVLEKAAWAIRVCTLALIPLGLQYEIVDGFTAIGQVRYAWPLSFWRKAVYFAALFVLPSPLGRRGDVLRRGDLGCRRPADLHCHPRAGDEKDTRAPGDAERIGGDAPRQARGFPGKTRHRRDGRLRRFRDAKAALCVLIVQGKGTARRVAVQEIFDYNDTWILHFLRRKGAWRRVAEKSEAVHAHADDGAVCDDGDHSRGSPGHSFLAAVFADAGIQRRAGEPELPGFYRFSHLHAHENDPRKRADLRLR